MRKSERLLNLLIMLLVQRRFVPKARIRDLLYADQTAEAFEKMFERDKEELRSIGVPIELGHLDSYFEDEPGYRINPDQMSLPEIRLDPQEAAVISLAAKVWEHARLAETTTEAIRKLGGLGVDVDASALELVEPRLGAEEPSFDAFWEAVTERTPVTFDYIRSGSREATTRHLQPWGVVRYSGRWYVVGYDTDRQAERVFRLSRVQGQVTTGRPGSYTVPAETDVHAVTRRLVPEPVSEPRVLLARTGSAAALRRAALTITPDVTGPDAETGWDRLEVPGRAATAEDLLALGPDVVVEQPASLRREIVTRLRRAVASTEADGAA